MLGAIAGDVIGSVHEFVGTKTKDFPLFDSRATYTDDTVLSVAVADWIMTGGDLVDLFHRYVGEHPGRGYGLRFGEWARARNRESYGSYGNGSAMRVSAVGFAFDTLEQVLDAATRSAAVTHDHPEGIRGAQAVAAATFVARRWRDKERVREEVRRLGYDLRATLDEIRPRYAFNETCHGTVPQALTAFLESTDFEDAVRNAVSLGGDADTLACIAGGVAEAFYGPLPARIEAEVRNRLDPRLAAVADRFRARYAPPA